jgi:uncharacterized protein YqgV (UPF0045/DUF77 family)
LIVEIHCSPTPSGTEAKRYAHIDAAIAEAQTSGLKYEVGALGTTIEGSPDELWPLLRRMHEATLKAGATTEMTHVRMIESTQSDAPTMDSLVDKFRTK